MTQHLASLSSRTQAIAAVSSLLCEPCQHELDNINLHSVFPCVRIACSTFFGERLSQPPVFDILQLFTLDVRVLAIAPACLSQEQARQSPCFP